MACAVLCSACQYHYHSSVPTRPTDAASGGIGAAGVWTTSGGALDPAASQLLAQESGYADLSAALSAEDAALLLADPASLARAVEWRRALHGRLERRHLLVGEIAVTPVFEQSQWIVYIPIPLVVTVLLVPLPITYGKTPDVPHTSVSLRVIDLEEGVVAAEYFEVMHAKTGDGSLTQQGTASGLVAMGLRPR